MPVMKRSAGIAAGILAFVIAAACQPKEAAAPSTSSSQPAAPVITINGAGATFPYPIYSKWFDQYQKVHPNVRINYQSIGSGGGIKQLTAGTVFFGASDGPMSDDQLKAAPGPILHLPTVLGAVTPIYNITGVSRPLQFTGATLADIYLGRITKWNDARIAKDNAGVALPATDIVVVHRSDGSGTTYIWCDFLSKVSADYKTKVGVATSVSWPTGVGGKGNEGVAGLVRQTPGAIGYVELIYALQNNISFGAVRNKAGEFVTASLDSVTAAAAKASASMPADFRVSITNADGPGVYPIASFTWILLAETAQDKERSRVMVDFMKWALTDGQHFAGELHYAPLPKAVIDQELQALEKIQS
jgi:phosphate transport system substrate-binding protein